MRRFWGWGVEGEGPTPTQQTKLGASLSARFGVDLGPALPPPTVAELDLPTPRVQPPNALAAICTEIGRAHV